MTQRICKLCNSNTTWIVPKTGRVKWYIHEDGYKCHRCYRKWSYRNSPTIKKSVYRWRNNNPEIASKIQTKYIQSHPEVSRKASMRYRHTHPEKVVEWGKTHFNKYGLKIGMSGLDYAHALMYWSRAIKKQDNNLCQVSIQPEDQKLINSITGINSPIPNEVKANVSHHLLYRAKYPELSLNFNNGISLSKNSHKEVHGWCMK